MIALHVETMTQGAGDVYLLYIIIGGWAPDGRDVGEEKEPEYTEYGVRTYAP